jgi:ABC-2 type transport system ATP-binding protein
MEEADRLCGRLAIVDEGRIVVDGAPGDLKRSVGADHVEVTLAAESGSAADGLVAAGPGSLEVDGISAIERTERGLSLSVADAHSAIPAILRRLDGAGLIVEGLTMREPTLDDVFLRYCGRHIRAEEADQPLALGWM